VKELAHVHSFADGGPFGRAELVANFLEPSDRAQGSINILQINYKHVAPTSSSSAG
jgi:hypothetical protein